MAQAPVFLINLDRSKERLARSQQALNALSIQYERVQAIEGAKLPDSELAQYRVADYEGYYKQLSPAEYGCYLSHRKCWQLMMDRGIDKAIILEDDVELHPAFAELCATLDSIPSDWECLKLTEFPEKRRVLFAQSFTQWQLVTYDKAPSRTGAYAITLEGAKKMLRQSSKIKRPVDIDFQYAWEHGCKVFGLKPYPITVKADTKSTIDGKTSRDTAKKSVWKQFTHALRFKWQNHRYMKQRLRENK